MTSEDPARSMFRSTVQIIWGIVIAALITMMLIQGLFTVTNIDEDLRQHAQQSEEWCAEEGGYLYNAQSVAHGGLHCDLENGELVHMFKIEELGYTHDWDTIRSTPMALHSNIPWYQTFGAVGMIFLIVLIALALIGWLSEYRVVTQ